LSGKLVAESPARTADPEAIRLSPRAGCALSLALGLTAAFLVSTVLILGLRGEIVLGRGIAGENRIWWIHNEAEEGLGVSRVRSVDSRQPGVQCEITRVDFLLRKSQDRFEAVETCECYRLGPEGLADEGACPP
jgi:hypothetical protein